jgi:ribosome-interacting GTPase 1
VVIAMPTILEQIADIEAEMARTQRNKATERHFGVLKAKLAKLRRELITPKGGSSGPGEGFDVAKTGDARIGFVGRKFSHAVEVSPRPSISPRISISG